MAVSNNRGDDWIVRQLPENYINRLLFTSDSVGYVLCGLPIAPERLYRTRNQGITWERDTVSPINANSVVQFSSESHGIVINGVYELRLSGWEYYSELSRFDVHETFDSGINWSVKKVEDACTGFIGLTYVYDNSLFYILGKAFCRFSLK